MRPTILSREGSIGVLDKIIKTYPKTATAVAARQALDRPAKNAAVSASAWTCGR